jgi:hypothetical protein
VQRAPIGIAWGFGIIQQNEKQTKGKKKMKPGTTIAIHSIAAFFTNLHSIIKLKSTTERRLTKK